MQPAIKPQNEEKRLDALRAYKILDTTADRDFDNITSLASSLLQMPIALISLIDDKRQWFKSRVGLEATETSRDLAFCAHAILDPENIFEVPDAISDERFYDNPLVTSDPNIRFYAGAPLLDSGGNALGTLCIIDRKKNALDQSQKAVLKMLADQAVTLIELKSSKNKYKKLIQSTQDLIYELDQTGRITFANHACEKVLGYSSAELTQMTCWDLMAEPAKSEAFAFYLEAIKKRSKTSYKEFPIQRKNGETLHIGQTVDYEFDGDVMSRAYVIAKDITELVIAQEHLKKSEEQYRLVSEGSSDMICLHEPNGVYRYVSASVKNLLGYDPEELIGTSAYDIIHPDQHQNLQSNEHTKALRGKEVSRFEYLLRHKQGHYVWMESYAKPILDSHGQVKCIQTSSRDITDRKKQAEELKKAKEEAEASGRAKENFLSTMSHEIRTPLNAIIGTVNLLSIENPDFNKNERFELLKQSSTNLLALINNVLDINKMESGNLELDIAAFDLCKVLEDTVKSWLPNANQRSNILKLEKPDQPIVVRGDSVRIGQVVNNIISNAIKFTNNGLIVVTLSSEIYKDTVYQTLTIEDSGVGVPANELSKIFERFHQIRSTENGETTGTGLGLAICKQIVEAMNGDIQVSSQIGLGTKFTIRLPLELADEAVELAPIAFGEAFKFDLHALLVEDNLVNQSIAVGFLDRWGVKTTIAENGREALEKIKSQIFDIVFMDLRMPVMDGYACATMIRSMDDQYFQSIPIIALTASAMTDVKHKIRASGMNEYLSKPFDPTEFFTILKKYGKLQSVGLERPSLSRKYEYLYQLLEDEEQVKEVLELSLHSLGGGLESINQCLNESQNVETIDQAIHTIKPNLTHIGRSDLVDRLPGSDRHSNPEALKAWVEDVRKALEQVSEDIQNFKEL